MTDLVHTCPHCHAQQIALKVVATDRDQKTEAGRESHFLHLRCGGCGKPSSARVTDFTSTGRKDLMNLPLDVVSSGFRLDFFWPVISKPSAPDHLPDAVAKAFIAAEAVVTVRGMEEMAAASYGRALDIGTKKFAEAHAPDLVGGNLYGRIEQLSKRGLITKALADWAHAIRLIRNNALHEPDGVTEDDLVAIRGFSETVLTYMFSLPGMLAARQAATQQKPDGT